MKRPWLSEKNKEELIRLSMFLLALIGVIAIFQFIIGSL